MRNVWIIEWGGMGVSDCSVCSNRGKVISALAHNYGLEAVHTSPKLVEAIVDGVTVATGYKKQVN